MQKQPRHRTQHRMMVATWPAAPLEVVQADVLLEFSVPQFTRPPSGKDLNATCARNRTHDFDPPAAQGFDPAHQASLRPTVDPHQFDAGKASSRGVQHKPSAVVVLDVRAGDQYEQQ